MRRYIGPIEIVNSVWSKLSSSFVNGVERTKCFVVLVLLANKLGWGGGAITLQIQIYFTLLVKKKTLQCTYFRFGVREFMLKKYKLFGTGKLLAVHP